MADLFDLLIGALALREEAFLGVQRSPEGPAFALTVVLLAGVATALGQSVVLFINRVKPKRFVLTVLISSALYVFSYAAWAISLWGLGRVLFASEAALDQVIRTVGLGYAPHLFSFLAFIPFLGIGLGSVLTVWSLFAIVIGVQVGLGLNVWQAFVCAGLGWLALQVLQRTLGHPLLQVSRWLKARAAGVEQIRESLAADDLIEEILEGPQEALPEGKLVPARGRVT